LVNVYDVTKIPNKALFSSHSIEKLVKLLLVIGGPKQLSHQHILFLSRALFLLHYFKECFS